MAVSNTRLRRLFLLMLITCIALAYGGLNFFLAQQRPKSCRKIVETDTCEEGTYSFDCPESGVSIFNDQATFNKCVSIESSNRNQVLISAPMLVKRKCSMTNLVLLSFEQSWNQTKTSHQFMVPNRVHYVYFGCKKHFTYLNYLSFYSVHKFIKPELIILHGNCIPKGDWWRRTIKEVANIYSAYLTRPRLIQGSKPMWIEHAADVARLQILHDMGGIYLDTDVLVMKSLDELRNFPATLGREGQVLLNNGVILAQPKAAFICVWLEAYRQYNPSGFDWNTYSVRYPFILSFMYKASVHVEEERIAKPNMHEAPGKLFSGHFDWSQHYTVHVWKRTRWSRIPKNEKDLYENYSDCSLGDIMKYVIKSPLS